MEPFTVQSPLEEPLKRSPLKELYRTLQKEPVIKGTLQGTPSRNPHSPLKELLAHPEMPPKCPTLNPEP